MSEIGLEIGHKMRQTQTRVSIYSQPHLCGMVVKTSQSQNVTCENARGGRQALYIQMYSRSFLLPAWREQGEELSGSDLLHLVGGGSIQLRTGQHLYRLLSGVLKMA